MNIYETCPVFITPRFNLRLIKSADAPGLLKVYSDKVAWAYFNADNCTSSFRYTTLRQMQECVDMWVRAYREGWFVRWTILQEDGRPVGTVEMFRRDDGEDGRGCGVLRMDVLRRHEFEDVFCELLEIMLEPLHEFFDCAEILTKAPRFALQRREALEKNGFRPAKPQKGQNGLVYDDYWSHRV